MYEPLGFIVPGFPPAMPPVNQPPISLTDQEILCVIAALQTLGGTPTVTMKTTHKYYDGTAKKGAQSRPAPLAPVAVHLTAARSELVMSGPPPPRGGFGEVSPERAGSTRATADGAKPPGGKR
jgi:hypothetical protein